ncbi:MAG: TetR family transcriptional regulator [Flavobacteriales bacterium]|nr:TetR family transcriptional regulator [Flavobacteriales bacterium]
MSTRDRIITEALSQFNKHGIHKVGVREIARNLNISPGNLSYHFPKKEDLLLEVLSNLRARNEQNLEQYRKGEAELKHFLELVQGIFQNQYDHRGVLTELLELSQALRAETDFDYALRQQKRRNDFKEIIRGLSETKQLNLEGDQLDFLVSFMTLFGRFWIAEAFVDHRERDREKIILHYLKMVSTQLSLFATEAGQESIVAFWDMLA